MYLTRLFDLNRRQRLAFGLAWHIPRGHEEWRKERRSILREFKGSHDVVLRARKERPMLGVATGLTRSMSCYSAAVLLGGYVPQGLALLAVKLDHETTGVVATRDGRPLVGFDVAASHEAALRKVAELHKYAGEQPVTLFASGVEIHGSSELDLEELLKRSDVVKQSKLSPTTLPIKWVVGAATLVAVVASAAYGWMWWQQQKALERARLLQARQTQSQGQPVDPNVVYRQELPNRLLMAGTRVQALPSMLKTIHNLTVTHRGWRLAKVVCTPVTCLTDWKADGGTYADLDQHPIPHVTNMQFSQDFTSVTADLPVEQQAALQGVKEESLLATRDFMIQVGSLVQKLSRTSVVKLSVKDTKPFGVPATVDPAALKSMVRFGQWDYSSHLSMALIPNEFPPGFTVEKLMIEVPVAAALDSITVQIEGNFYVKS